MCNRCSFIKQNIFEAEKKTGKNKSYGEYLNVITETKAKLFIKSLNVDLDGR